MQITTVAPLALLSVLTFTATTTVAQPQPLEIQYSDAAELTLNTLVLDNATTVEAVISAIGKPSRTIEHQNGETSYFYDESGVVFFTSQGAIQGLGINFNWDGDKKFPEKSYTGSLALGGTAVTTETKSAAIAAISTIEFICPIPLLCATKDRAANVVCTAGFKDEALTQVVFLIK